MSAMNLEIVSRDVSTDIGDLAVIQCALYTVKNRLVTEVLDSVSHVPPDFGETPVPSRVHHFVMRESVAKTMVTVHRDARQDGMGEICDQICSPGCKNGKCNRQSGICLDGCNSNWSGDHCDSECWKM